MSNTISRIIPNSPAAREPFKGISRAGMPLSGHSLQETQSSSVTQSGSVWLRALIRLAYKQSRPASQSETEYKKHPKSTTQLEKNQTLIQLLRSWREGDEQEQRSTWEYLQKALDEDRLSDRKLFP